MKRSGAFAAESGSSWMQTSSLSLKLTCGAGIISFAYKVSSDPVWDSFDFSIDGELVGTWSGEVGWNVASYVIPPGQHTFTWSYLRGTIFGTGSERAWIDDILVAQPAPQQVEEGFESGSFARLPWASGGNAAWVVQNLVRRSGSYAAVSGTIGANEYSSMRLGLRSGGGIVSFGYRVSSEYNHDYLRFYIDGVQMGGWSGEVGWFTSSFPVPRGQHTLEWRYSKDGATSGGSDKAWVDDISLPKPQLAFAVWQEGTNLVLSRGFSDNIRAVRSDSLTAGFDDYAMTLGPAGNLVLLWQEVSEGGSDAHYRVYDPASDTWSRDERLFRDPPLERSFAPVWDDVGNLTVAYNKVEILHTNKTLTLEGGQTITITNVPQPGRVDLAVTKRRLIRDVALAPGDFTVEGVNYLPGDPLALTAAIRNTGDLAVTNVAVSFFGGDPQAGGVLLTNVPLTGWLEGAASNTVQATWIVSEPAAPHTLFAVVKGDNDFDPVNNTQTVGIGGTDLRVSLVTYTAETNGAGRVIAQVQNLGAPEATNSVLAIRRAGETNAPLATASVLALEPGRLAQVALDLPAGTQPEGEVVYELTADDTLVTGDIDRSNNTTRFAVNLWNDSDKDGMPDGWERDHGLSPNDPADAAQDKDGDGVSNLAEYRAGTDPGDPRSYLWIKSLATGEAVGGVELRWGSVVSRLYSLLRTAEVAGGFAPVAQHVLATPPENVWIDTTATNSTSFFYRLQVE